MTFPEEIDMANADLIRQDMYMVLDRGADVMIADLSQAAFCDSAGVSAVVRAFRRARSSGTRMGLVVTAPTVLRVFTITGVNRLIQISPTVADALVSATGTA